MNEKHVSIVSGSAVVAGELVQPASAAGVVILVASPAAQARDERLAQDLARADIATLRVTLLTEEEQLFDARTGHYRYDADFLAHRLLDAAHWIQQSTTLRNLPLAYVGSTIGAAAALIGAALRPDLVKAVVTINGRTDLAADYLRNIKTPTLFLLNDMPVLRMNRDALAQIRGEKRIEVIHADDEHAFAAFVDKSVRWVAEKMELTLEMV